MTRHEFVFSDLGDFNYLASPYEYVKYPKMDQRDDGQNQKQDCEIIEDGDGRVSVLSPDDWTRWEVEHMLLDFYNWRARKLVEHLSLLDRREGV